MTRETLAACIRRLPPTGPVSDALAQALPHGRTVRAAWYKTQREHWLGCLGDYDGPGARGRTTWGGRSAEYVYNHIQCAPMLLWLAEAAGVPMLLLFTAADAALGAGATGAQQCAALRRVIPWCWVQEALQARFPGINDKAE